MTTESHLSFRPMRLSPRPLYGALVAAWLLILVVVVAFLVMLGQEKARGEFEQHAGHIYSELSTRLKFNDVALNGLAEFLSVVNRGERQTVAHYASAMLRQTPHIHSLGVIEEVPNEHLGSYLESMRKVGYPDIAVRNFDFDLTHDWLPAVNRPTYYPISLLVSLDGLHENLLGLDVGQVATFADALSSALAEPGAHSTGVIKLYEDGEGYALLQRVVPAASKVGNSTCLALLVIRTEDLIPSSSLTQEYDYHITLDSEKEQGKQRVTLLDRPSIKNGWLASLVLPKLIFRENINDNVPLMTFTIERRLTWNDINLPIISWVMFAATLTLLLLNAYMSAHHNSEERRLELEELLRYKAHHDELTGLPNRTLIMDRIEQGIRDAHREKHSMAVLFLDLNGFKPVNDTYGHEAGDRVLREVSKRLRTVVRDRDTVGRISGDEFIMILADTDRPGCEVVIDKIRHGFDAPFVIDSETNLAIGVSIGVSIYPGDGETPSDLMRVADNDMYRHKPRHP